MTEVLISETSDTELLNQFLDDRDEGAFNQLVERHGPMVMGICRLILRDQAAADDAYQAALLILAARAGMLRKRQPAGEGWSLGLWRRSRGAKQARTWMRPGFP